MKQDLESKLKELEKTLNQIKDFLKIEPRRSRIDEIQNVKRLSGGTIQSRRWLAIVKNQCQNSPWHERNFLKKAFLEACENAGVF